MNAPNQDNGNNPDQAEPQVTGPGVEAADDALSSTAENSEEWAEALRQRDEYLDQLRRAQADFTNYQKRTRAQAEAERPYAIVPLAADLLGVLDNFERAIDAARSSGAEAIVSGLAMVHKQLLDTLAKHGVEPISALGEPFDPNRHEALMQTPDPEAPEGTVVGELGRGYKIQDRILRPSKVAVSIKPQ
ncbi:nucleotide exchange factor GrpE [soil metagenome]